MKIEKLLRTSIFPDPRTADFDGFLAVSEELTTRMLLDAYAHGIFPWPSSEFEPIPWWSPSERAIFELDTFHVPRRLCQTLRTGKFQVTSDQAFREVMEHCANVPRSDGYGGTWITPLMIREYEKLFHLGVAHSVEVWQDGELAGGLYGVSLGRFFAGESMFHLRTDASKVALACTVAHLRKQGFRLFDTQMTNPHLERFHVVTVLREEYLRRLREAVSAKCEWGVISSPR